MYSRRELGLVLIPVEYWKTHTIHRILCGSAINYHIWLDKPGWALAFSITFFYAAWREYLPIFNLKYLEIFISLIHVTHFRFSSRSFSSECCVSTFFTWFSTLIHLSNPSESNSFDEVNYIRVCVKTVQFKIILSLLFIILVYTLQYSSFNTCQHMFILIKSMFQSQK